MSENNPPLIALVKTGGFSESGIHKKALLNTINAGVPTQNFEYSTFGDARSFMNSLTSKFDGLVIFYDALLLDIDGDNENAYDLKELIYKSLLYSIRKIIIVGDNTPDTDEHYENLAYISDFMAGLGFDEDSFAFISCPVSDFVNSSRPEQFLSDMRPLVEEINRVIVNPTMNPLPPKEEVEDFDGLVFAKYDGERLVNNTRVTLRINTGKSLAIVRVKSVETMPDAIYSKVNIGIIEPIPYIKGTRFMLINNVTGETMGIGSVL